MQLFVTNNVFMCFTHFPKYHVSFTIISNGTFFWYLRGIFVELYYANQQKGQSVNATKSRDLKTATRLQVKTKLIDPGINNGN